LSKVPPILETLELGGNKIGSKGLAILSASLEKITSLKTLDLSENKFGSDGAKHIANIFTSVGTNQSVFGFFTTKSSKDVSMKHKPSTKLNAPGKKNTSNVSLKIRESFLTKLNLRGNDMGDVGIQIICEALKHNSTLEILDLQGNKIGESGTKSIIDYLHGNSSLKVLNISGVKDRGKNHRFKSIFKRMTFLMESKTFVLF
jgi:Ran GTPase-activating protein (RanGAP) involved in mRNA processing and transport